MQPSAKSRIARSNAFAAATPASAFRSAPARLDDFRPQFLLALPLDLFPLPSQRRQQHGPQQRLDVLTSGVVRADLRALGGVQRPLEQRAEDRGLDAGPIVFVDIASVLISAVVIGITSLSANSPPLNQRISSGPKSPPWAIAAKRFSSRRVSMAGLALPSSNSLANSPAGRSPVSSPNMQNISFIRKWAARSGSMPLLPHAVGQLGEPLGRLDRDRLAGDARPQRRRDR